MAHEVRVRIDTAVVSNKDLEVVVKSDSGKIGTLLISKGNIEWLSRGKSVNKKCFSWAEFGKFMDTHGKATKAK